MLATLSRWRSWVQIPSGALEGRDQDGTVRKPAKRPRPPFGRCPKLGELWVRLPLVPVTHFRVVILTAVCKAVAFKL